MMTHNREWEGGKNGERMDCIEEKERWKAWGEIKVTE